MRDLPRFIKLGEDRINVDEIVSYGIRYDAEEYVNEDGSPVEDDEPTRCLYVETKTSESDFEYWEDDDDFDIDRMLIELDAMFLVAAHRR